MITETQYEVLDSLHLFKQWTRCFCRSSWVWDTPSNTERIMEQLVKKGFVNKDKGGTYRPIKGINLKTLRKRAYKANS